MTTDTRLQNRGTVQAMRWLVPLGILLLAFFLRFNALDNKSLWGDEIAQVRRASIALERIIDEYRAPPRYFLQFALIHFTRYLGTSELWMRLPSALASTLAVAAAYAVARRLLGWHVAIMTMLFMAVAPYQVWYGQDARMYGGATLYSMLSLYFLLRLTQEPNWRMLGAWLIVNTLLIYNHLFGFLVFATQGVVALGLALASVWRARNMPAQNARGVVQKIPRWFVLYLVGCVMMGIVVLPLLPGTLPFVLRSGLRDASVEWRNLPPFHVTPAFLLEQLGYFGLNAGRDWRMWVSLALALVGWLALLKGKSRTAWITLAWLGTPLLILEITHPRHEVVSRYLIFMQPVYLMLMAHGVIVLAFGAYKIFARAFGANAQKMRATFWIGSGAIGLLVLAIMVMPPLQALYQRAKINDWRAIADYLRANVQADDFVTTEQDTWGSRALTYYWQPPGNSRIKERGVAELEQAARAGKRIWYISLGGYFDPAGEAWVQKNLTAIDRRVWERADLVYRPTDEFVFPQSEGAATIYVSASP